VGIFEFILLIALISTAGKVLTERRRPPLPPPPSDRGGLPPGEAERMREAVEELAERVGRLEEERDFYRELLDSPRRRGSLGPGDGPPSGRSG
jgi:hypothetical protein